MVTAILTKDIMIIGTGYLRGQDPIANFRKIMPHVKHVKLFISRTYFEWIQDTNKWTNITYDVTTVTQETIRRYILNGDQLCCRSTTTHTHSN